MAANGDFMNIFKKLFGKSKSQVEKKEECWYNNAHEKERSIWNEPLDGAALSNPNQSDHSIIMQTAKH